VKDVAPGLLAKIQADFEDGFKKSDKIKRLNKALQEGNATYEEANELAIEVGEILADAFQGNLSIDELPDGKMYYNIADRIVNPPMKQNYDLISAYA